MNLKQIIESDPTKISAPPPVISTSIDPRRWRRTRAIHPVGDPDLLNPNLTYAPQLIGATSSWHESKGKGVTVAILDSGIEPDHEEFTGRVKSGINLTDVLTIAEIDENLSSDVTDDNGHGTHIAGILAAAHNNEIGSAGIAPECQIMPVKVLDAANAGSWGGLAAGIYYAVDNGADIINISAGSLARSEVAEEAIAYAVSKGKMLIAAAGNFASNMPIYPAAYEDVIAVSATTALDTLWPNSNFGDYITLSAPGEDIWSTYINNTWRWLSGTSMAAPHVSGIAALICAAYSGVPSDEIKRLMIESAVKLDGEDFSPKFGYGRIDIYQAFQQSTLNLAFGTNTTYYTYFPFVSASPSTRGLPTDPIVCQPAPNNRPRVRELGMNHWQLAPYPTAKTFSAAKYQPPSIPSTALARRVASKRSAN